MAVEISVIIPTCGSNNFIYETFLSLENQMLSHNSFEIIVVANGVSDFFLEELNFFFFRSKIINYKIISRITLGVSNARNLGIENSIGDYICFVDDDDRVSEDYIARILRAAENDSDCIGIEGIITFDGGRAKKFIHSLRYDKWFERRGTYYRNPNHLNPIKRELALKEPFMPISMGEDSDFSKRMLPHLHSETYIEKPIYFYDFIPNKVV